MITAVVIVIVFGGLIFFHELGHFLVAKRAGVQVNEFAIGFGPRVAGARLGETEYNLRLFPLGGFVRMAGMYGQADEADEAPPGRRFIDKSPGQRAAIALAGPLVNFLLSAALLTVVLVGIGVPRPTLKVAQTQPGMPAAAAGIRQGDEVVAVDGRTLSGWQELQREIKESSGRELALTIRRDGAVSTVRVRPVFQNDRYFIGIVPETRLTRSSLHAAVPEAMVWTANIVLVTFKGTVAALKGEGTSEILGPVGIGQQISEASRMGLGYLLMLAAVLSANLGLLNLFPIPALDGSRLVFIALEALRGRPIDPEKESWIHLVGFAIIMLLLLAVTYRDLVRLGVG